MFRLNYKMRIKFLEKEYYGKPCWDSNLGDVVYPLRKKYIVKINEYKYLPIWRRVLITSDLDFAKEYCKKLNIKSVTPKS